MRKGGQRSELRLEAQTADVDHNSFAERVVVFGRLEAKRAVLKALAFARNVVRVGLAILTGCQLRASAADAFAFLGAQFRSDGSGSRFREFGLAGGFDGLVQRVGSGWSRFGVHIWFISFISFRVVSKWISSWFKELLRIQEVDEFKERFGRG